VNAAAVSFRDDYIKWGRLPECIEKEWAA